MEHQPLCDLAKIRFCESDRRIEQRFQAMQTAVDKAEHMMTLRLESMNEFRRQILEERAAYVTRRETILLNGIVAIVVAVLTALLVSWAKR